MFDRAAIILAAGAMFNTTVPFADHAGVLTVRYSISLAGPGWERKHGTVVELLLDIPYFDSARHVPSYEELNELFAKGICDAGMSGGCRWKPFQISREEYAEVVEELLTHPQTKYLKP